MLLVQVLAGDDLVLQGLVAEGVAVAIPIGSAGQSGVVTDALEWQLGTR